MSGGATVLDHGYVRLVETWGGGDAGEAEAGIIEAARQSTQGSFRGWDRDERLLRFLFSNKPPHATPFEFAGMVIEVQAPIFVFREWHRHRTQSYNEMSARYAPLPDLNYLPTVERVLAGGTHKTSNRQAGTVSDSKTIDEAGARAWLRARAARYAEFEEEYQGALADGVPKELARIGMPVGRYSRMRASTCLRNWLAFLTLRMDPGAQWEIRQYAAAVAAIVAEQFPRTWALFDGTREQIGREAVPSHYAGEREAIDAIRDSMTDDLFAAFCDGNALKYRLRAGKKTDGDAAKADWYEQMARHVRGLDADPRSGRVGFTPYIRRAR